MTLLPDDPSERKEPRQFWVEIFLAAFEREQNPVACIAIADQVLAEYTRRFFPAPIVECNKPEKGDFEIISPLGFLQNSHCRCGRRIVRAPIPGGGYSPWMHDKPDDESAET